MASASPDLKGKEVSPLQAMILTLQDATQRPKEATRKDLVARRSETFKSVSMYFCIATLWWRLCTSTKGSIRGAAALTACSTTIQSLFSAKYHAVCALTPFNTASTRLCSHYHQDIIGICCNALFVASLIIVIIFPKLESALIIAAAFYVVARMHGRFAKPPSKMASKKFPHTAAARRAMISSYASVLFMLGMAGYACRREMTERPDDPAGGALAVSVFRAFLAFFCTGLCQLFGPKRGGIGTTFSHIFLAWAVSEMSLFMNRLANLTAPVASSTTMPPRSTSPAGEPFVTTRPPAAVEADADLDEF